MTTKPTHEMTNSNPLGEHEKQCPQCERIFITDDLRVVYCSALCKSRTTAKPRSDERREDKSDADGEFKHTCKHCGKEFRSHSKRAVYCSESCRISAANARNYQKNRSNRILTATENRRRRKVELDDEE